MPTSRHACYRLRFVLLPVLALVSAGPSALADGKMFRLFNIEDSPHILTQRALIDWRDGVETLIVQSDVAFDSRKHATGQSEPNGPSAADAAFGWILPVPAPPTSIEACAPYLLTGVAASARPNVESSSSPFLVGAALLFVILTLLCIRQFRKVSNPDRGGKFESFLIVMIILAAVVSVLIILPSLSRAGMTPGSVEVLQTVQAGVYDVTVIRAQTPENSAGAGKSNPAGAAVRTWLSSNGFDCPKEAEHVLDSYADEGWCFLASKVSPRATETTKSVTHHPLKVRFPADKPVYPMRLTAVGAQPIDLDLFVLGDSQARTEQAIGLDTWLCTEFERELAPVAADRFKSVANWSYHGPHVRWTMPDLDDLGPGKRILTRLHGRLHPADMTRDIAFTWEPVKNVQAQLYTWGSAAGLTGAAGLVVLGFAFVVLSEFAIKRGWNLKRTFLRRFLPATTIVLIAATAMFAALPKEDVSRGRFIPWGLDLRDHRTALAMLEKERGDAPFEEAYREHIRFSNDSQVASVHELTRAGDYAIEPVEGGWRITLLAAPSTPYVAWVDSNGVPMEPTTDVHNPLQPAANNTN